MTVTAASRVRTATAAAATATGSDGAVPGVDDLEAQLQALQDQFDGKSITKTGEKLLKELGLGAGVGSPDKHFTQGTEDAVKKFQSAAGLHPTGALDTRTINAMRKAAERKHGGVEAPGQKSTTIKKTEQQLKRLGYDAGAADGVYDAKTAKAMREFKHDQGIKGNKVSRGLAGKGARKQLTSENAKLNHDPQRIRVKKTAARAADDRRVAAKAAQGFGVGAVGKSVSIVQKHLKAAGFDPKHTSGTFDERTAGALKQFQRKSGLNPTGVVNGATWNQLKKATLEAKNGNPTSPPQNVGERSGAVKSTEKMLRDLGMKPGSVDGKYTENTQKAVDKFRRKKHLGGVGQGVGPGTLRSIRKAWKAKMTPKTNTVAGCAKFLLQSKNVSFWSGLSSGSDRKNVERLARGEKAFVPATGGHVKPKLALMQALVEMAKHGHIQINALTGGTHSPNSNHYRGTAVDLDLAVGNTSEIVRIANKHGGIRNFETDHIHLDF